MSSPARTPLRRTVSALAVPAIAVGLLAGPGIGVASAHSELIDSDPAADSTLEQAPEQLRLTFNEAPQEIGTELQLTGPDGEVTLEDVATVEGTDVLTTFPADLPDGDYELLYRVTSADGHPISGEIPFTLDLGEEDTTTTAPEDATGEGPTTEDATEATSEDAGAGDPTSAGEEATTTQEQVTEEPTDETTSEGATSEDAGAVADDDETTSAEPGPQMSSDEASDSDEGGSSAPLIIGIVVAVLAIGGIGWFLASRGGSRSDSDTSGQ